MVKLTIDDAIEKYHKTLFALINEPDDITEVNDAAMQLAYMGLQALEFCRRYGVMEETLMRDYLYGNPPPEN